MQLIRASDDAFGVIQLYSFHFNYFAPRNAM